MAIHPEGGGQNCQTRGGASSYPPPNSSERWGGRGGLFKLKFAGTVKGGAQGKQRGGEREKIPHTQKKKLISPHIIYHVINLGPEIT